MGQQLQIGIDQFLNPQLQMPGINRSIIIQDFIGQTAAMVESFHPELTQNMKEFQQNWDHDPKSLIEQLNKYFTRANYYLYFDFDEKGDIAFNIFPIKKTHHLQIKEASTSENIPVIILGSPLVNDLTNMPIEVVAQMDSTKQRAMIFDNKIEVATEKILNQLPQNVLSTIDRKEFEKCIYEDFLNHESYHVFLAKKYPKTSGITSIDQTVNFPLILEVAPGLELDLSGDYHQAFFHELAAVGFEITNSQCEFPYLNILYTTDKKSLPPTYTLVADAVTLMSLGNLPNSDKKQSILQKMKIDGSLEIGDLRSLIGTDLSIESSKKVGNFMLTLSHNFFKQIEENLTNNPSK